MKYCPYCGVVLSDGAAPFCADCGNELPNKKNRIELQKDSPSQTESGVKNKPPKRKKNKSKKHQPQVSDSSMKLPPADDYGYDGYYDDVPTEDGEHIKEGVDAALVKRIILLGAAVIIIITLTVLAMYFI